MTLIIQHAILVSVPSSRTLFPLSPRPSRAWITRLSGRFLKSSRFGSVSPRSVRRYPSSQYFCLDKLFIQEIGPLHHSPTATELGRRFSKSLMNTATNPNRPPARTPNASKIWRFGQARSLAPRRDRSLEMQIPCCS